jgi:magnesium chelatase subunit D
MSDPASATDTWADAERVAALIAVAPSLLGGLRLRAGPGPVRKLWLETLQTLLADRPLRRVPLHVTESHLLGGLNLTATLSAGHLVAERGLLAQCNNGVAVLAMAERCQRQTVTHLCSALDNGAIHLQREGIQEIHPAALAVIALDEGLPDEHTASALNERLAFYIDLHNVSIRDVDDGEYTAMDIARAREQLPNVTVSDSQQETIAAMATVLGVSSPRAWMFALRTARVMSALTGRSAVHDDDITQAIRLCLAHRATQLPEMPADLDTEEAQQDPETPDSPPDDPQNASDQEQPSSQQKTALPDQLLEAATAAIPAALLEALTVNAKAVAKNPHSGTSGALQRQLHRGRPIGVIQGDPRRGGRLSLIDTLRAAVPWQRLRDQADADGPRRIRIERDDFRLVRFNQRSPSTTIFVVDASGSAALHRLAEAKGAVELLLADCYVRRDEVALIAFRGQSAELLLPPTRSLVRAKRSLAGLPGGGGTPLASAIELADAICDQVTRSGHNAGVVFLTDGVANIARDGSQGRERATADALTAAANLASRNVTSLVIDTSPRAQSRAKRLAEALDARYVAMPHADAKRLKGAIAQTQGIG